MGTRRRLWWVGLAGSVVVLATLLVVSLVGSAGQERAREVARRWVEVHDWKVDDCEVLGLFTDGYLEEHGFTVEQCRSDPSSFFSYWFMESETAGSTFELVDVHVRGESAVAEVEEHGGSVTHLRLFMVFEGGDWRIEAVGASLT